MLKNCVICGEEFTPPTNSTKACSEKCKVELKRRTAKKHYLLRLEKNRTGKPVGRPRKPRIEPVYKEAPINQSRSKCWSCQNYGGKCSWSRAFKPVDGWEVEIKKVIHKEKGKVREDTITKVVKCPEYKQDERRH
jgi:hypothetical protein